MKFAELRAKNIDELQQELHTLLKERFSLCMQKGLGETPRTHSFKEVRRNIARVKTVLTEKKKARERHE
jgi:large subunit ribosomal protein L29